MNVFPRRREGKRGKTSFLVAKYQSTVFQINLMMMFGGCAAEHREFLGVRKVDFSIKINFSHP